MKGKALRATPLIFQLGTLNLDGHLCSQVCPQIWKVDQVYQPYHESLLLVGWTGGVEGVMLYSWSKSVEDILRVKPKLVHTSIN